jgi:hypothetical protein
MLGIDEHRYRSVRFFQDPATKAWTRYEPWMTTIVSLDTGQVLGIVDGRGQKGLGDWLFAPAASVAARGAGRRDRPVRGVPESAADVAAAHRGLGGSVSHDHVVGQRHVHHRPAGPVAVGSGPAGPSHRPGVWEPDAAAESRREPVKTRPT